MTIELEPQAQERTLRRALEAILDHAAKGFVELLQDMARFDVSTLC
jgi:hypothetical protein